MCLRGLGRREYLRDHRADAAEAINGHTRSRSSPAIAALNATGRGRKVEPVIVRRRNNSSPALNSAFTPPITAMTAMRPSVARQPISRAI